jgi:hypothetical protein
MLRKIVAKPLFWLLALPMIALGAYLAFSVFGIQGLWIDHEVNEDFPAAGAPIAALAQPKATPSATPQPTSPPLATDQPLATVESAPAPPTATPPATPTAIPAPTPEPTVAGPVLLAAGQFYGVDHEGSGDALIYRQPDGTHILRLENFAVTNAPDMYVYVVAAPSADTRQAVLNSGFLNLGKLKGNKGNQNYSLPPEYDPAVHRSVTIWCKRFTVVIATAPLS